VWLRQVRTEELAGETHLRLQLRTGVSKTSMQEARLLLARIYTAVVISLLRSSFSRKNGN
jgi:hypothetical protein